MVTATFAAFLPFASYPGMTGSGRERHHPSKNILENEMSAFWRERPLRT
jgi:hypothetical protein